MKLLKQKLGISVKKYCPSEFVKSVQRKRKPRFFLGLALDIIFLFKKRKREEMGGYGNIIERVNLFKVHCTYLRHYRNETPLYF
jgi:hypothetical protein